MEAQPDHTPPPVVGIGQCRPDRDDDSGVDAGAEHAPEIRTIARDALEQLGRRLDPAGDDGRQLPREDRQPLEERTPPVVEHRDDEVGVDAGRLGVAGLARVTKRAERLEARHLAPDGRLAHELLAKRAERRRVELAAGLDRHAFGERARAGSQQRDPQFHEWRLVGPRVARGLRERARTKVRQHASRLGQHARHPVRPVTARTGRAIRRRRNQPERGRPIQTIPGEAALERLRISGRHRLIPRSQDSERLGFVQPRRRRRGPGRHARGAFGQTGRPRAQHPPEVGRKNRPVGRGTGMSRRGRAIGSVEVRHGSDAGTGRGRPRAGRISYMLIWVTVLPADASPMTVQFAVMSCLPPATISRSSSVSSPSGAT